LTSSAGRLFGAIAALIGLRDQVQYEAQAATQLEMLPDETPAEGYPFRLRDDGRPMVVETKGIITGVVDDLLRGEPAPLIAGKFHATLTEIILIVCCHIRELTNLRQVALSGGMSQNIRLSTTVVSRLRAYGFEVYTHSQVPANDGGIPLGQAAVANAVLAKRR
jgi:hydrogenase maturation protein HypF